MKACPLPRLTPWLLVLSLTACNGGSEDGPGAEPPPPSPPGASVRPDASNTGVPAGTVLRAWPGSTTLADSGAVLDGYDFAALPGGSYYRLTGSNLTLRNCRMASGLLIQRTTNVRIERCEIVGGYRFPARSM